MGRLILVTGGSRSGKSAFAEKTASLYGDKVLYIATALPFDEEMKLRIEKHRSQRPIEWETFEGYKNFKQCIRESLVGKDAVLLDCITVMVSNLIFEENCNWNEFSSQQYKKLEERVIFEIEKLNTFIDTINIPFIVVTNETGMGIIPENRLSRTFSDIAGKVNQIIANRADEVYLSISGISIRIK